LSSVAAQADAARHSRWFRPLRSGPEGRINLFCFPYAGSGPAAFRQWPEALPPAINVIGVCYPGREARMSERPYTALPPMIEALAEAIRPWLDQPFAFFGHSMGAFVAYALANRLARRHGPLPDCLFVSGASAPHLAETAPLHVLPSREFLRGVVNLEGIPDEVLGDTDMLRHVLRLLRADLEACETYLIDTVEPVSCPLCVFGGDRDPRVSVPQLHAWSAYAGMSLNIDVLPGRHFFLHERRTEVIARVRNHLRKSYS